MYSDLGEFIRGRRESLGLEQAQLASVVGLRQQAISGWERGASRPRRTSLAQVAQALDCDESTLVDLGLYRTPTPPPGLPVQSLSVMLPYGELQADTFEHLMTELMRSMLPGSQVSRYGGPGETQDGIDILALAGGKRTATGQCKRHKRFGAQMVKDAVEAVRDPAPKNYLFLARTTATVAAREEAANHDGWELWDGDDISRYIRTELPFDRQVRLVATYFPAHVEAFLGVATPGPFALPEDHFHAATASVFHHDWALVGRDNDVARLVAAIYGDAQNLALLAGPGGMGKTRVLKALTEAAPEGWQVRVLPGAATPTAVDFELLPATGCLTAIVDDAHEASDVAGVVSGVWRRNPTARVLVASRPYAVEGIKSSLKRNGLLPDSVVPVTLEELQPSDARALARQALGDDAPEHVVKRLAALTADSPLSTVVGGTLIRSGRLAPHALEQADEVKNHIMSAFADALVADPMATDPTTRRRVATAIAAVQPFRANDPESQQTLARIVGQPYDELALHIRSLENAGVLRRRRESLRLAPDLLGDALLVEAVFDGTNPLGTGYLDRIGPLVDGASVEHLFINVTRVDWQKRNSDENTPDLVRNVWSVFADRMKAADIVDRSKLLETLAKVAYFQPQRALDLTRWLIDNPTDRVDPDNTAWSVILKVDYGTVLAGLPAVIKAAAMTEDTLPEAMAQLWDLAKADTRPTNQYPDHPQRVLTELAQYTVSKPVWFNDRVLDIASQWFGNEHRLSPFDILSSLLATDVHDTAFEGNTFTFRRLAIDPQVVAHLRSRVVDLAFTELDSEDLRRAGAAAAALKAAVQAPVPAKNEDGTTAYDWTGDVKATIDRIAARIQLGGLDPALLVRLRDVVFWHDAYGSGPAHDAAAAAIDAMGADVEAELALVLHDGWGHLHRQGEDDMAVIDTRRTELEQRVLAGLAGRTDVEAATLIDVRLTADFAVHGRGKADSAPFLGALTRHRPGVGAALLATIRSRPVDNVLDPLLPVVLSCLVAVDPQAGLADVDAFLEGDISARRYAAAQAIGTNRNNRPLHDGELETLLALAKDATVEARFEAARAAQNLAQTDTVAATTLLAATSFGDDTRLAEAYFWAFRLDVLSWANFTHDQIETIYADLIQLPDLDSYTVQLAIAERGQTHPEDICKVLKLRVEYAEMSRSAAYHPIPHQWTEAPGINTTDKLQGCAADLIAWIGNDLDSYTRTHAGAELFRVVVGSFSEQVVKVIGNALQSGDPNTAQAAIAVLSDAPRTFVWDNVAFVCEAFNVTGNLGHEVQKQLRGALWVATTTGGKSGTVGQPFPQTIRQRDRSREVADTLPTGSAVWKFYDDLATAAEKDAIQEVADDRMPDGRDW